MKGWNGLVLINDLGIQGPRCKYYTTGMIIIIGRVLMLINDVNLLDL